MPWRSREKPRSSSSNFLDISAREASSMRFSPVWPDPASLSSESSTKAAVPRAVLLAASMNGADLGPCCDPPHHCHLECLFHCLCQCPWWCDEYSATCCAEKMGLLVRGGRKKLEGGERAGRIRGPRQEERMSLIIQSCVGPSATCLTCSESYCR